MILDCTCSRLNIGGEESKGSEAIAKTDFEVFVFLLGSLKHQHSFYLVYGQIQYFDSGPGSNGPQMT